MQLLVWCRFMTYTSDRFAAHSHLTTSEVLKFTVIPRDTRVNALRSDFKLLTQSHAPRGTSTAPPAERAQAQCDSNNQAVWDKHEGRVTLIVHATV